MLSVYFEKKACGQVLHLFVNAFANAAVVTIICPVNNLKVLALFALTERTFRRQLCLQSCWAD